MPVEARARSRVVAHLLIAALALTALMWSSGPVSAGPACGVRGFDGWTSITSPGFGDGGADIVDLVADPTDPARLYVTNGSVVLGTDNYGCDFKSLYSLPIVPTGPGAVSLATDTISSLEVSNGGDVFVIVNKLQGNGSPSVLVSDGPDLSAPRAASGLPPSGKILDLSIGRDQVFVAVEQVGLIDSTYVSEDGGASFKPAVDLAATLTSVGSSGLTGVVEMEADPDRHGRLWVTDGAGLARSDDSGATWTRIGDVGSGVGPLEVSSGRVTTLSASSPFAYVSFDAGASFTTVEIPAAPISLAHGPHPLHIFISTASPDTNTPQKAWVSRFAPQFSPPWGLIKKRGAPISDLEVSGTIVYGRSSDGLMVYDPSHLHGKGVAPPANFSPCNSGIPDEIPAAPRFQQPDLPGAPKLTPRNRAIELEPGEEVQLPYSLLVPPTPTPLDIFFLVDVSGSMQQEICGIRSGLKGIVDTFAKQGVDVWFGAGQFRGWEDELPYGLLKKIGPPNQALVNALYSMAAEGGTNETQLTALYQAATGAGWDAKEFDDIPRGGEAGFREAALKVIVMVTDEKFGPNDDDPPRDLVKAALQERGIYQVGISPGDGGGRTDMMDFAEATGARAPVGGVDCDGDGLYDLAFGYPLVCGVERGQSGINLAPTIVGLAGAITDQQPARLEPIQDEVILENITPRQVVIDVKKRNSLDYGVTLSCAQDQAGRTFELVLRGEVGSRVSAPASVEVRCLAPVATVVPPPPSLGLGLAPPIPPPNAPVNAPQPRPDIQGQTNPQSQAQAQGAVVPQRQAQPQVAFVHAANQVKEQLGMELQMVRADPRGNPLDGALYAIGIGSLTMLVALSAVRARPARARVRSRSVRTGHR